jgi:hypothetical protein
MTLWADPETARPIRVEFTDVAQEGRVVMSNFRYNVDLDPSLFSLEPPEGYSVRTRERTKPFEEDLLGALRTIAENSEGVFPAKLGMHEEVMKPLMAGLESKMDGLDEGKLAAEVEKVLAKYGGKEKLKEKYGKDIPPEIRAEITKAGMPFMREQIQKQIQQQAPIREERMRGIRFFMKLEPENDPHYAGGGVKLGTPDRPILWYKPTGAEQYRVIYADLSVKEMTPEDVKKLPEPKAE